MDALRGMDVFVAIAETGSFTRGAARLQISPALASQQVKQMETRLGVRLVDRSTRHLRLTEEGKTFYASASAILRAVEEAELKVAELGAAPVGRLRVEAPVVLIDGVVLPVLLSFREQYPDITLEFVHSDEIYDGVNPECEVIIRLGPFSDSAMIAHSLGTVPMGTFASPAYLARHGAPTRPEDLARHTCINFINPRTGVVHPWAFVRGAEEVSLVPAAGIGFNQGESRIAAALHGLGIYRGLTLGLDEHVRAGRLVPLLTDWQTPGPPIIVAHSAGRMLSRRARCFVDHLRTHHG